MYCAISCKSIINLQFIVRNFEMILIKKTTNKTNNTINNKMVLVSICLLIIRT